MHIQNTAHTYAPTRQSTLTTPVQNTDQITQSTSTNSPERAFDFTNMTLKEQSEAANTHYESGYLTMGEMAFLTGRYGLIKHDGQLGGTTLNDANTKSFNVIEQMREDLAYVKSQHPANSDVVNNHEALLKKIEHYQYGINTHA
ncbi:hypothetical protein L1077_10305 [Pseudoalteromonas luteoviolacea]|uniref:hypothetical protein n=1 Tax=Pseudoalteromonas luteoviolacea TaxID=43657 RepID=UPI001F1F4F6E|nr:hypothetical protein [Pseudoalteromonas luteoviolacea]MCF6439824.1 hypothetical protein [Pseudoalteromonas luteoviolacea]